MRKRSRFILVTLICMFALVGCKPLPAGKGVITGTVILEGETSHSGVQVKLQEKNTTLTTTVNGSYTFNNLADGTYTLLFSKEGFNSATKTVMIHEGLETVVQSFTLTRVTHNPKKAELQGHSCYFDFDTGQTTTDFTKGDIRLDAFSIYQNYYLLHLDEMDAHQFEEEYNENGAHTFNQFGKVNSTEYPLERKSFNFYTGDVFLLKTDQGKFVKLLIYDFIAQYDVPGAPSVKFFYLYDNIVDTSKPTLKEIKLYTENGAVLTQTPGEQITFDVTSRPAKLQLIFDEFVQMNLNGLFAFNEGAPLYFAPENLYLPYYDSLHAEISDSEWGISTPGTYNLTSQATDFYFADVSGNRMIDLPFESLVINYTSE